ncbi:hypothetical protein DBR11_04170 [Pedobacter sp. HMWF019]|nr:hypothetical protein DBR11_04170 [Pedobacter sp. HMWF019]
MNKRSVLVEVIAGLFILLFVYAAVSKLQDFEKFRVELGKSPILNAFSDPVSIFVPVVEIVISVMLVAKRLQFIALYLSFSLMVVFSAYIVFILKFSSYIPCSCGGILQNMTWTQHLIFNVSFMLLGALAILIYPKQNEDLIAIRGNAEPLNRGN